MAARYLKAAVHLTLQDPSRGSLLGRVDSNLDEPR